MLGMRWRRGGGGPILLCIWDESQENIPLRECVCVEVLRPSQLYGVMSSVVSLPDHTFTGQA